jgi:hypothetical protein
VHFHRIDIPVKGQIASFFWRGDVLVDSVAGNVEYRLDGTVTEARVNWGYRFDAAIPSGSGQYVVIYEKLGTKGLLLRDGKLLRELNRSFYCAEAYEYPVAFASAPNGRELLIHCPDDYNRIDFEDTETGERLTAASGRKLADFFHSRLAISGDGRWLLSAGWIWHPFNTVRCFDIGAALRDPAVLDDVGFPELGESCEVNSATFLDNDRLLVASAPDADDFREDGHQGLTPGHLGVFRLDENRFESVVAVDGAVGTLMPAGPDHVVSFFQHPRVIDWRSGEVVATFDDLVTGDQNSSIIWHNELPLPALALDAERRRFAVAGPERITVIEFHS